MWSTLCLSMSRPPSLRERGHSSCFSSKAFGMATVVRGEGSKICDKGKPAWNLKSVSPNYGNKTQNVTNKSIESGATDISDVVSLKVGMGYTLHKQTWICRSMMPFGQKISTLYLNTFKQSFCLEFCCLISRSCLNPIKSYFRNDRDHGLLCCYDIRPQRFMQSCNIS